MRKLSIHILCFAVSIGLPLLGWWVMTMGMHEAVSHAYHGLEANTLKFWQVGSYVLLTLAGTSFLWLMRWPIRVKIFAMIVHALIFLANPVALIVYACAFSGDCV